MAEADSETAENDSSSCLNEEYETWVLISILFTYLTSSVWIRYKVLFRFLSFLLSLKNLWY